MLSCKKCGHTGKSNYGLKLSITLMFLTIYGVEKSQCDRSKCDHSTTNLILPSYFSWMNVTTVVPRKVKASVCSFSKTPNFSAFKI